MQGRKGSEISAQPGGRLLAAVTVVLIATIWALVGFHSWRSRSVILDDARQVVRDKARLLAAHTERTLFGVARTLDDIAEILAISPAAGSRDAPEIHGLLKRIAAANPHLRDLLVLDGDGRVLHWTVDGPPIDVPDRDYFRHLRDDPSLSLYIGTTQASRDRAGEWVFGVSRPLRHGDGSFQGAVVGIMDAGYFLKFYRDLLGNENNSLALIRTDGTVLIRVPAHEAFVGRIAAAVREMTGAQGGERMSGNEVNAAGGVERIIGARRLSGFPLVSVATVPTASALHRWRQMALTDATLAAIASGIAIMAGLIIRRQMQRIGRSENALSNQRNLSTLIIDSLPGIFYMVDHDERLRLWNRNFETVTGWGAEELAEKSILDFFTDDDRPLIAQRIRQAFDTGYAEAEARLMSRNGDGVPHYFTATSSVIDGEPRLLGVAIDVSSLKAMEETLRRSNRDLQQFAYVASHDLQTPLRTISSYLQLLKRRYGTQLDSDAGEFIDFAVGAAQRMSTLVLDLLQYSRVTTRPQQMKPVDCAEMVQLARRALASAIADAGAEVVVDTPLPVIPGDSNHLGSLFQNLIGNAVKYRDPARPPLIRISAHSRPTGWEFAVADNGIGIEPRYFDRIFVMFQRLHGPDSYEGTGIGLALCKTIVERHGGRIWVESSPGAGSTFRFILGQPSLDHETAPPPPSTPPSTPKTTETPRASA
ncbi:MAG: ATP-binding protein [Alphaproteobacteria bacterium]